MSNVTTRDSSESKKKNKNMESVVMDAKYLFTDSGLSSVRTYLGNVSKGQPNVYTAPFAKGDSMEKILNDWFSVLESIRDKWPSLWEFENDLAGKVGPMSVQKPLSERITDIEHYYDDILLPSTPISSDAIAATISEFSAIRGLRPRSAERTVELMKKSTNSGVPYFTKRRNVVDPTVRTKIHKLADAPRTPKVWLLEDGEHDYKAAAILGWRGQEGGPSEEDVKQRVVWMFPFAVNLAELQVYQPLIEACQATNLVSPWISMDAVDAKITQLFDSKADDDLIVCTDFSKFDQHFNSDMQDAAAQIIEAVSAKGSGVDLWLSTIFPIKYNIPLVVKAGDSWVEMYSGPHGMGSGSGGTNADETLAHRTLQHEAALAKGKVLNPNSQCLGDDGLLSYPGITVEDVVEVYRSHGQEMNESKQYASTQDCVFLRRWHHKDYRIEGSCVGVYSTCRALGRLRYLERFMDPEVWSPTAVALRQLSILENCKFHPLREEFVNFCMKRDKYRLGIDIPGFLDNIAQIAIETTDLMDDFLGYTKTLQGAKPSGIADWWIVKYLKSLR